MFYFGFILCLILSSFGLNQANTYKAAVVEYASLWDESDKPADVIKKNVEEYIKFINEAGKQKAQIIVFPEYGLTATDASNLIKEELDEFSITIPEAIQNKSLCGDNSTEMVLQNFSCAAINNNIYIVVNLIGRKEQNSTTKNYFNTNIVFDPNGSLIEKYYKINLFHEHDFTPGSGLSTFTTNFNVTFGMFTCFDILFKHPSVTLLKNAAVTDVIYPTAWFSETPYLTALSTQAGYSRASGINLLAANYHRPEYRNTGSGIYLANGSIAQAYISGTKNSKLIIQEVPIVSKRSPANNCVNASVNTDTVVSEDSLEVKIHPENFENYTLEMLEGVHTHKKVCSEDFCCTFNVTLMEETENTNITSFKYLFAVFHGVRKLGTLTSGIRTCGIIACETGDVSTCGSRHLNYSTIPFSSISITGKFHYSSDTSDRPSTLNFDLTPVNAYTFCASPTKDNQVDIKMSTKEQKQILSFGFYSRIFSLDGKPPGVYKMDDISGETRSIALIVGVLIVLVIAALVCAYLVYRKSLTYRSID